MRWTGNPSVHQAFEILGYLAGITIYASSRSRGGDPVPDRDRAITLAGAAIGAMIGARALSGLSYPYDLLNHLIHGKTLVGGLLGGLIGVEFMKRVMRITQSTGDLLVTPLIAAICVGRIGCFLMGPADQTAGLPTSLPWGVSIADGVVRHPVALYEIGFLLVVLAALTRVTRDGDRFRIFLFSYLAFRLLIDFLKPDPPRFLLGLSSIQWACIGGMIYYSLVLSNASRNASLSVLRRRRLGLHAVLSQD